MNLGTLNREPNSATKHEIVKEKFKVFNLFNVGEVAVVH